ncbi:hypothetical protein BBAD15_g2598 [Beauveria bassiana D1-5]|uniref:Uncharacterized protein n=1 Tax=Beauveria bassiana D1-5 TaxID=1245745 RepID=A0A0A2VUY2_BEABA|nr:hypothetical protein BBAD15_g2598 [Beauveria bassiana D1-5]
MTSVKDIKSKLAEITGKLTAGGTNAQMKEWYQEYNKLNAELKAAEAAEAAKATSSTALKMACEMVGIAI